MGGSPVVTGGVLAHAHRNELPGRYVRWVVAPADYLARFADCTCAVYARTHGAVAPRWCTGHESPADHFARFADGACVPVTGAERTEHPSWCICLVPGIVPPTHQFARSTKRTGVIRPGAYGDYPFCFPEGLRSGGRGGRWLGRGRGWRGRCSGCRRWFERAGRRGHRLGRGGRRRRRLGRVRWLGLGLPSGGRGGCASWWRGDRGGRGRGRCWSDRGGGGRGHRRGGWVGESPQAVKLAATSTIAPMRPTRLWWSALCTRAPPYHSPR